MLQQVADTITRVLYMAPKKIPVRPPALRVKPMAFLRLLYEHRWCKVRHHIHGLLSSSLSHKPRTIFVYYWGGSKRSEKL